MTQQISPSNTVKCPNCNHEFPVTKAPRGSGAQYVHDWQSVNSLTLKIMTVWISRDELRDFPRSKNEACTLLQMDGIKASTGSLYARISEMLGLRILTLVEPERKPLGSHATSKIPRYRLDVDRAATIINANGKIV